MMINYACKFCGRPAQVDPGPDRFGIFDMKKWITLLCCNSCGEFMEDKRKIEDAVKHECLRIWAYRKQEKDHQKVSKEEVRAEEILTALTKRYARLVCDHYRVAFTWDAEFTNMLMDNPQKSNSILFTFRNGIKKASTT